MMKHRHTILFALALMLISGVSPADSNGPAMEEVLVIATQPVSFLRKEIFRTQERLYDSFNEQNDDDRFDVICRKEATIGSQIRFPNCRPRFFRSALADATTDTLLDGYYGLPDLSRATLARLFDQQHEKMAQVAKQNPEFNSLLKRHLLLRRAYAVATGASHNGEAKMVKVSPEHLEKLNADPR